MKKITLIRHAKSSWSDMSLKDHDRPLNDRGKRDAPFMAKMMASRGWSPDALVSSTANRAFTTASHLIANLDKQWNSVAFFGHNPTFTSVVNLFYQDDYLGNLPTCGIVEIEDPTAENWEDFAPPTAVVTEFHYPKQYF